MAVVQQSQRAFMFTNVLHQPCLCCAIILSEWETDVFCQPPVHWHILFQGNYCYFSFLESTSVGWGRGLIHDWKAPLVGRSTSGKQTVIQALLLVSSVWKVPGTVLAMSQVSVLAWQDPVGHLKPLQLLSLLHRSWCFLHLTFYTS